MSIYHFIVSDLCYNKKVLQMITRREAEILELITQQRTSKEIAIFLHISVSTVETHRRNLFRKFGVRNAVGLIKEAMREGLV